MDNETTNLGVRGSNPFGRAIFNLRVAATPTLPAWRWFELRSNMRAIF